LEHEILEASIMKLKNYAAIALFAFTCFGLLITPRFAAAHFDTLDGPVIKDARLALEKGDVTPVLKWVQKKDEAQVGKAFHQALAAKTKGEKGKEEGEHRFFETLVKIHRAGEGAPFTSLKPAGTVEPVIAAADTSLISGSDEEVVKLVTDAVTKGIRERHRQAAELYKHKDESVEAGRNYVKAYVEYTHYVEKLQQDAVGHAEQHQEPAGKKPVKHHEH
jgi:hypothetical protein